MALINSIYIHRQPSHLNTRLELRDEATYFRGVLRWLAPIYIAFGVVDAITTGSHVFSILVFRAGIAALSLVLFVFLRGRCRFGFRLLLSTIPYVYGVEWVMIRNSLQNSPYFAGFGLVLFGSSIFFPLPIRIAFFNYMASVLPVGVWYLIHPSGTAVENLNLLLMTFGTAFACAANAAQLNRDLKKRLVAQETLARDLGQRQIEVWRKANELIKRKAFESQFSPQVVAAVLEQGSSVLEMRKQDIAVMVIDIEDSTTKAKTLDPVAYKTVVEEVFDVFSSACLRWNVTVDKFTGDGAQAFAGAPVQGSDDFHRAIMAARDTLQMLQVRKFLFGRRWKSPLKVRIAVCEGSALVGFLGRGSLKSFTAIGDTVSFTHRLCSAGEAGKVTCYSLSRGCAPEVPTLGWVLGKATVTNLKGFGNTAFAVSVLTPSSEDSILTDNGRCKSCGTPLILDDLQNGLPTLMCPACATRNVQAA